MSAHLALFLVGCLFSALWASAFVAGKVALLTCDPLSLLCARFAVAGLIMVVWAAARSGPRSLARRDLWLNGLILGLFNNALYLGLSFVGLQTVSPETTVLIVSTAPFLTTGLTALTGGARSLWQMVGGLVGFCGVYVVLSARMRGGGEDPVGLLLIFVGTAAFAVGTVYYRLRGQHHDAVALNGVQNLAGALLLAPFAPDPIAPLRALGEPGFLLAFAHLVVAVSIVDFLIWLGLVRRIGAAHAASFHLLNPVFGVALSAAVFGTAILSTDLIGTTIVIVGLMIVVWDTIARSSSRSGAAVPSLETVD